MEEKWLGWMDEEWSGGGRVSRMYLNYIFYSFIIGEVWREKVKYGIRLTRKETAVKPIKSFWSAGQEDHDDH